MLNWAKDGPHVVIAGGARTGKTNLLHAAALSAALSQPPDALRMLLVDFSGRSLRALAGLPHALHTADVQLLELALADLAESPIRTAIFIDDYDLAADVLNAEGGALLRTLRDLARMRADTHIWAAGYLDRAGDPLMRHLMLKRAGFALGGRDGLNALGLRAAPEVGEMSVAGALRTGKPPCRRTDGAGGGRGALGRAGASQVGRRLRSENAVRPRRRAS